MARAVFEIYDVNGSLTMDLSKNLTRILGYYVVTKRNGQFNVNKQPNERLFAYVVHPSPQERSGFTYQPINYWINGNTVYFKVINNMDNLNSGEYRIIYGVY